MMMILVGLSVDLDFRLRLELYDLEPQRIPSSGLGILRRIGIGELNGGHPVAEGLLGSGALPQRFEIANLRQISDSVYPGEEADSGDLRADCAPVLMHVKRGCRIGSRPLGIPNLIAGR